VARSRIIKGSNTDWAQELADALFEVTGEPTTQTYRVAQVDSPTQLTLDRPYEGGPPGGAVGGKAYSIRHPHPLFVDCAAATGWQDRYFGVGYDQHVTESTMPALAPDGQPLRGVAAATAGDVVSLDGNPDLSALRLTGERLILANDTSRPSRTYRITAV